MALASWTLCRRVVAAECIVLLRIISSSSFLFLFLLASALIHAAKLEEDLGVSPSPELALLEARIAARDVPGVDEGRRRYPRPRRPLRLPYSLGRAHFVGRDGEYALLAERLREAMGGSGGAVAVEGEAGIG